MAVSAPCVGARFKKVPAEEERHLVGVFDHLEDAGAGVQREAEHDRDVHDAQEFMPVAVNARKWAKSAVHCISERGI